MANPQDKAQGAGAGGEKPAQPQASPGSRQAKKGRKRQAAAKVESAGKGRKPEAAEQVESAAKVPPRLKLRYREEIVPALMKQFGYRNPLQVPRVSKVVVNMGVGEATQDAKQLESAAGELAVITGQKSAVTRAKKSIAGFKVREKMAVGCRVTLRRDYMYEFLDRLFNVALPRIRDFRGLPARSVDGRGNYSIGLQEQVIFPEVDLDSVDRTRGMDVTIVTTAKTDEEARALLTMMGAPIREA